MNGSSLHEIYKISQRRLNDVLKKAINTGSVDLGLLVHVT